MAAFGEWTSRPTDENVFDHRTDHDSWVRHWTAIWTKGSCVLLFGCHDPVAHSAYLLGHAWYRNFILGYCPNRWSAIGCKRFGGSARPWDWINSLSIVLFSGSSHFGEQYPFRHVPGIAHVCRLTEVVVLRPSSRIDSVFAIQRESANFNLGKTILRLTFRLCNFFRTGQTADFICPRGSQIEMIWC